LCREKSHDRLPFHDFRAGRGGGRGEPPVIPGPQFPIGNRYNHSNTKLCIKVYIDHCRRPAYKRCASNLSLGWTNYISLNARARREENAFFLLYIYIYFYFYYIYIYIHIFICTIVQWSLPLSHPWIYLAAGWLGKWNRYYL
jgi:hypothetical protein